MVNKARITKLVKSLAGNLEYTFSPWNYADNELIVLCMHSTPQRFMHRFKEIFHFLTRHFKPISPSQLPEYYSGNLKDGPYVLFTFDDGLKNNTYVADFLLQQNVRAFFFVVPDFVASTDSERYYRTNIRNIIEPEFDNAPEDVTAMSLEELAQLVQDGHAIGSHTMSHMLRKDASSETNQEEVVQSKKWLEEKLNHSIASFCSPIQTNFTINALGKALVGETYKYHFTTFPGENSAYFDPLLIFRRNIEVNWLPGQIKFALGKKDLKRWKLEIEKYSGL